MLLRHFHINILDLITLKTFACYFISSPSKYFPQNFVLKHPSASFSLLYEAAVHLLAFMSRRFLLCELCVGRHCWCSTWE